MTDAFSSRLSKKQAIAVLVWLPVHLFVLPFGLSLVSYLGYFDLATANFAVYLIGAVYMSAVLWRFFRRDFDALCDHPFRILILVLGGYFLARFGESLVLLLFDMISLSESNLNNDAVIEMVRANLGPMAASAVILAPIVEESIFRAGIFGLIRRKNRFLAYAVSALLFGLYHVWGDALADPMQLVFILQYLPSALVLAYLYERSESIWTCIFFHMLSNGAALMLTLSS